MRTLPTLIVMLAASATLAQDFKGNNFPLQGIERDTAISIVLGGRGENRNSFALTSNSSVVDWYAEATVGEDVTTLHKFGYDFSGSFEISATTSIELSIA